MSRMRAWSAHVINQTWSGLWAKALACEKWVLGGVDVSVELGKDGIDSMPCLACQMP